MGERPDHFVGTARFGVSERVVPPFEQRDPMRALRWIVNSSDSWTSLNMLVYGVTGIISGAIGAAVYNLFAGLVGGISVDVE